MSKVNPENLTYQLYIPLTTMPLRVDVFPGMFIYCEQQVEDTRGKTAPYGQIPMMTTNNQEIILGSEVQVMVPFGYFLVLRCNVLHSVVFEGENPCYAFI